MERDRHDGQPVNVRVAHASPGRLRLKVVSREVPEEEAVRSAELALAGLRGVQEVRANPVARSVLVRYDPLDLELPALLEHLGRAGVTPAPDGPRDGEQAAARGGTALGSLISGAFGQADRRVARLTGGAADLRTLLPVGLAALAAREVLSGRLAAAPWYVLLWYAFDSYTKLQKQDGAAEGSTER